MILFLVLSIVSPIPLASALPYRSNALDLFDVHGDNAPLVQVDLGYPKQKHFNLVLDLNYETSWVFTTEKCTKKMCSKQCFQTNLSQTYDDFSKSSTDKTRKYKIYGRDLITINDREFGFQFGLVKLECPNRYYPYSGVFSLSRTAVDFNKFIHQFNRLASFFIPSEISRVSSQSLVFGEENHPACDYNHNLQVSRTNVPGRGHWQFYIKSTNAFGERYNYTDSNHQIATLDLGVNDIYAPESIVFELYKVFNVIPMENTDVYYLPCNKLPNAKLVLQTATVFFLMEAKHLVTRTNSNKCIFNVKIHDSASKYWILGKVFMRRFCTTLRYDNDSLRFGVVSEKRIFRPIDHKN
ncbi:hypothetical protein M3Y95_00963300 [Aphelenchoides besseyi]|nr:hypothetical protein M3Y95_00963300 [Aphelenchoides besseyi]